MSTEIEVVFVDGDAGGASGADGAPPIDTTAPGAPDGGHQKAYAPADRGDGDGPRREDFQGLTKAVSSLAQQMSKRAKDPDSTSGKKAPSGAPTEDTKKGPENEVTKLLNTLSERINERLHGAVDRAQRPLQRLIRRARDSRIGQTVGKVLPERAAPSEANKQTELMKKINGLAERINRGTTGAPTGEAAERTPGRLARLFERMRDSRFGQTVGRAARGAGRAVRDSRIGQATGRAARGAGRAIMATRAGQIGARVAGGVVRAGAAVGVGAGAAAASAPFIGPFAIGVGIAATALAGLAIMVLAASKAFKGLAHSLEEYSGPISAAMARNEAARELRMVERAQRIGPQVATVTAAQGRFDEAIGDLKTSLLEEAVKIAPLVEGGLDALTFGVRLAQSLKEEFDLWNPFLTAQERQEQEAQLIDANRELTAAMFEILRTNNEQGGFVDPDIEALLGLNRGPAVPRNVPAAPGAAP